MIFYTGFGYLVGIIFIAPVLIFASILNWGFGIDVLSIESRWPLHSLMFLGAVTTFVFGWYFNRSMVEETTYEKSGPVRTLRPKHTLYWIRIEYWGPIILAAYFILLAVRYLR
jgi:arginine exporter protein ArgO